jgi:hypothetical protein
VRRLLPHSLVLGDGESHPFRAVCVTAFTNDVEQLVTGREVNLSAPSRELFDPFVDFSENGLVASEAFSPLRIHQSGFSVMS